MNGIGCRRSASFATIFLRSGDMPRLRMALCSGAGATFAALTAITYLSRQEGQTAARPVNATSHVLWGPEDATRDGIDLRRTASGVAINIASAFFWAALFALAAPPVPKRTGVKVVATAFRTALLTALVDYRLIPRRLRPGWELALPGRSVALALAAWAGGLPPAALRP